MSKSKHRQLTKEEMIEKGLLPPTKIKAAEAVQVANEEVANSQAAEVTPVDNTTPVSRQTVSTTSQSDTELFQQFSNRGQLVVSFVNSILTVDGMDKPADEIIDYGFKLADEIQNRTNRDFVQATIQKQMEGLSVKASKD